MKVISFSLWGDKPMYMHGAIMNIQLAKEYYPGWECWFHVDETFSKDFQHKLTLEGGRVVRIGTSLGAYHGMFWRFTPNDDPEVEIFVSRDCDSRISPREVAAVNEWIASDKKFHTMHDHYHHRSVPVLGGMWGAKRGCISDMEGKILAWRNYTRKGIDQDFLRDIIWPTVKSRSLNHSSIPNRWAESVPFPEHEKTFVEYVGQAFNEKDESFIP